jgi:ankyrin repeat protein
MTLPNQLFPILTPMQANHLMELCQQGRLFEIEEWIDSGKSLQVPPESRTTPLRIAMEREFHSLVLLLARNDTGQQAKDDALSSAVSAGNLEFIELLVKHGADLP